MGLTVSYFLAESNPKVLLAQLTLIETSQLNGLPSFSLAKVAMSIFHRLVKRRLVRFVLPLPSRLSFNTFSGSLMWDLWDLWACPYPLKSKKTNGKKVFTLNTSL